MMKNNKKMPKMCMKVLSNIFSMKLPHGPVM